MTRTSIIIALISICYSCKPSVANSPVAGQAQNDTISYGTIRFQRSTNDTLSIKKAIEKYDSLISVEKDEEKQYSYYQMKINQLVQIGEVKQAFVEQGKAVSLLPADHLKRIEYQALQYYLENDTAKYVEQIRRAIQKCKEQPMNASNILGIATYYILIGDDGMAKQTMRDYLKKENDVSVKETYRDFKEIKRVILEGRKLMVERIQDNR